MLEDNNFKITLIKALEQRAKKDYQFGSDDMSRVILSLPQSNLYIEETGLFTRVQWNTYCSILHIQVPLDKQQSYINESKKILDIAQSIYGRQEDNLLTDIDIGILVENNEIVDFSSISITNVIEKAVADAEMFMGEGKYDSAFDRIHTAFHGYLRKILENKQVEYEESDTLSQLYTKLHSKIEEEICDPEIAELVKKTIRSASGVITAINDIRNRHSLSHPNQSIIEKREAEFVIHIVKDVSDYIARVI